MPEIYMKHPIHGSKVAMVEAEAQYDEKLGWSRYDPYEGRELPENTVPDFLAVSISVPESSDDDDESDNALHSRKKRSKHKT